MLCIYFAKLATAAASVLYTWNTAVNLVNSRTSLNFLLRLHNRIAAPWLFALKSAATNVPSPELSI